MAGTCLCRSGGRCALTVQQSHHPGHPCKNSQTESRQAQHSSHLTQAGGIKYLVYISGGSSTVHIHVLLPSPHDAGGIGLGDHSSHLVSSLSSLPCSCLGLTRSGTAAFCHFGPTRHGIPAPFPSFVERESIPLVLRPFCCPVLFHTLDGKPPRTRHWPPLPLSPRQQQTIDSQHRHNTITSILPSRAKPTPTVIVSSHLGTTVMFQTSTATQNVPLGPSAPPSAWPTVFVALPDCLTAQHLAMTQSTSVQVSCWGIVWPGSCLLVGRLRNAARGKQDGRIAVVSPKVFHLFSPGPSSPCPLLGILWPRPTHGIFHNPILTDMAIS